MYHIKQKSIHVISEYTAHTFRINGELVLLHSMERLPDSTGDFDTVVHYTKIRAVIVDDAQGAFFLFEDYVDGSLDFEVALAYHNSYSYDGLSMPFHRSKHNELLEMGGYCTYDGPE
jgi:hypothetical protein